MAANMMLSPVLPALSISAINMIISAVNGPRHDG
jgi:hypothetical protein